MEFVSVYAYVYAVAPPSVPHNHNYKLLHLRYRQKASIRSPYPPGAQYVLASLDGLVCLGLGTINRYFTYHDLAFWNPLTGDYKKLSSAPGGLSIRFDAIGFYTDASKDYKLVYLGSLGAYIYSLRLDSWTQIASPIKFKFRTTISNATLCGQCIYFTMTNGYAGDYWVICFDIKTESFRKLIAFPPVASGYSFDGTLVVLNGWLHLRVASSDGLSFIMANLWRINGDGDGWLKVAPPMDLALEADYLKRQYILYREAAGHNNNNFLFFYDWVNSYYHKLNTDNLTELYWFLSSRRGGYKITHIKYLETLVSPDP